MRIHDPALFAVVVPTFEGTRFLKRLLDYFGHIAFDGRIVLSDNSSGAHRQFVAECARHYGDLDIEVCQYPEDIRFLDKLTATLRNIDSRFVMLHAHDDFMIPAAVERCVAFLSENADYSVARGRVAMVSLSRTGGAGVQASLWSHPMRAYEESDPVARTLDHVERYASTFYSVHRRETLIESFELTEAATKNVIFFQYLSSCISVLRGKVSCSEELFYVRQGHVDSWSGSLKGEGNYEHWPMLITSPDFSRLYQEFRGALSGLIARTAGVSEAEAGPRIDRAAIALFQRSFCGQERDNPAEASFLQRLENKESEQSRLLASVVQFTAKYKDTL